MKLCQHGDVYLCAENGTDTALWADCKDTEVCDADMGSCRPKLCDPGKVNCDATHVVTCNAFGSGWEAGEDCATKGNICVNGSCTKQLCAVNGSFCQDGAVYNCDSTGTKSTLSQTCKAQTEHCETYSGGTYAYCRSNDCVASSLVCDGNTVKTCNSDGTLPVAGNACSNTQYCESGACKDRECVQGTYYCKNSDIYYCDWSTPYLSQSCVPGSTACEVLGSSGASCAPLPCSPSSSACIGNKIGVCAADGQSLASVSNDCTTATKICTSDLACAASTTDIIGVSENVEAISASSFVGDVIEVNSPRKLTEIQVNLVLASPRELRWTLYELSGSTFVAKIDKLVSSVSGTGFLSSVTGAGTFSYELKAGKRYLIGVAISGGDGIDYLDAAPISTGAPSFGTLIGRVYAYYNANIDAYNVTPDYATNMKIVTESP